MLEVWRRRARVRLTFRRGADLRRALSEPDERSGTAHYNALRATFNAIEEPARVAREEEIELHVV